MSPPLPPGPCARIACLLEATARKPGNVHRFRDFDDEHYADFLLSATALGAGIALAPTRGIGAAVLRAIEDTARVVATNTNLGMVLLIAPLAAVGTEAFADEGALRRRVASLLAATTVADARLVYRAIRLARPGGLGIAPEQDVAETPTATLTEVMRLAADRDLIARQYATDYADLFATALPALHAALAAGRPLETAILSAHLAQMAARPDTLIARKRGPEVAAESARRAAAVLASGWPAAPGSMGELAAFDDWLRADGHARNPGATADLVAAALFVALRRGTIELPRRWGGDFARAR